MKKETFEKAAALRNGIDGALEAIERMNTNTKGCGNEEVIAIYINNNPLIIELRSVILDHLNKKIKTLQKQFDNLK